MKLLKAVLVAQAVVLLVYGLPYLLVPKWMTAMTGQLALPENYILRALGIAFVVLAYLEYQIAGDLERYRGLTLAYALLPALFLVTILAQAWKRGFNGAAWYWMLNGAVTGIFTIAVFASQLFAATRFVLNRMFGMKGRTFFGGLLFDLGMMAILTLLFFVTMGITAAFAWMKSLVTLFGHGFVFSALLAWTWLFLAVVFNTVLFVTLYRFVPIQRICWPSVVTGSVATAVLWELAKQLFRFYIESVGVYRTMYGSLGVTIALIMWIYYSAVVFVLGAAVIRVLEERRSTAAAV